MSPKRKRILVVDDVESIRFSIADSLSMHYAVDCAENGREALRQLTESHYDFVITDIRMPKLDGIELSRIIRKEYPEIECALMTAYNINDYIRFAREEQIWNIIPKTSFLNLRNIQTMVDKLLSRDIFGIEKYFPNITTESIGYADLHQLRKKETPLSDGQYYSLSIQRCQDFGAITEQVGELLAAAGAPSLVHQVIEELVSNAKSRAPRDRLREGLPNRSENPTLMEIGFGLGDGHAIFTVCDFEGSIQREDILLSLERQVTCDPQTGLPLGLADSHGRGLFISRESVDHLIFNIERGRMTEVIALFSTVPGIRNRALSIYQR